MLRHALPRALIVVALAIGAVGAPAPAVAGGAIDPSTLIPPPFSPYECHGVAGAEVRCDFNEAFVVDPFPTGLLCGSGAATFEVWDGGEIIRTTASRFFDSQGRITKRVVHETFLGATFVNPLNGATVRYTQSNTIHDTYQVPGDLTSAIEPTTGNAAIVLQPGAGAILLNAGRSVWAWDAGIDDLAFISSSGPQAFVRAFVYGDLSVLDPVCSALGG